MKLIKNIFIIALLAFISAGCEDFLEPNSKSEFVPKDATSLNELLLGEAYLRNDMSGFNIFLGLLDDDIEASPYQMPNEGFDDNKFLASFTWQPSMFKMMEKANSGHTNMYEKYYELILGANAVIDYLPNVVDAESEMGNIVKAQAFALRGFYYFNLVNIFGVPYNYNPKGLGVPLKLHSGMELSETALNRKTVAEVYAQILSDFHTAENIYKSLPEGQQWKKNFRTSLPMVQLMLSRTYLYMENWEKASMYAEMVMNNPNFNLVNLYETLDYEIDDEWNYNIVNYPYFPTYNSPETIWSYGNVEDMFSWTHYGMNVKNTKNNDAIMYSYFQASEDLLNTFDQDWDLRYSAYIIRAPKGDDIMPMPYGKVLVGTKYYKPEHAVGVFGRCLRLSEAYLNYAEAEARIGDNGIANAIEKLTELRENRYDDGGDYEIEDYNQEELIEFIKEERRRELCFEGHRWFDLRRWGMPAIKHVWHESDKVSREYTLEEKDLMYTIPIPDEALQENAQLVQNELNESERTFTTINK